MGTEHIAILVATGLVVGFAAGLLGLGGAFFLTPVQYFVFTSMGLSSEIAIKMAFGTTLLIILPTAASGTWQHNKKKAIQWRAALTMGSFAMIGGYIGSTLAVLLPGSYLKVAFGGVALAVAIRMLIATPIDVEQAPRGNLWLWLACAFPVGIITGILGIGGGVIMIPLMVFVLRFGMHMAVANSLAMMILTSIGGIVGYVIHGLNVPGLPAYSLGYVYLPAWLPLTITCCGMAPIGAIVSHKLPAKQLKYIFIALMFYMGLRMVGLFDFLGLPL